MTVERFGIVTWARKNQDIGLPSPTYDKDY